MHQVSFERVLTATCLLALAGCRCDGPLTKIPLAFRADVDALDFGRVLEGDTQELVVTLTSQTRAAVAVTATVDAPFEVPAQLEVPGGSHAVVTVRFHAGSGPASGVLVFTDGQAPLEVRLTGLGVKPLPCVPSAPCLLSSYELAGDRCVETPAPDESPCDPGNLCLANGRCRAAQCVGVTRSCKDDNLCTADACSSDTGCVFSPIQCPAPTAACKVATCDPSKGCGVKDAPEGTPCGPVSCAEAHLCALGLCVAVVPPDGFPCLPAIACFPAATCQSQKCVRPDAGPWLPTWSARLDGVPQLEQPALLASGGQLYLTVCGIAADAGLADAGASDGGLADAGTPDAGAADDGGTCALASYTGTGYQRFITPFDDRQSRQLLSAEATGVVSLGAFGLAVHSSSTGGAVASLAVPGAHVRGVASLSDGGVVLAAQAEDGGAALATWDSLGLTWGDALPGPAALVALGADGRAYAWEADAGLFQQGLSSAALASRLPSLVVANGTALVGGQHLVTLDAGVTSVVDLDWTGDGGPYELLSRQVLAAGGTADVFFLRCDDGVASCPPEQRSTWVRAFDSTTGAQRWSAQVAPGGARAHLAGTALLGQSPGAVVTVVEADFDGGPSARLRVFALGNSVMECPLGGVQKLSAVAFGPGRLYVLGVDGTGVAWLEGYDAPGVVLPATGWAQDDGLTGSRREAP